MNTDKKHIPSPFDFGKRKVMDVRVPDRSMTKDELHEAWMQEHSGCPIDKFYTIKKNRKFKIFNCPWHNQTLVEEELSLIVGPIS